MEHDDTTRASLFAAIARRKDQSAADAPHDTTWAHEKAAAHQEPQVHAKNLMLLDQGLVISGAAAPEAGPDQVCVCLVCIPCFGAPFGRRGGAFVAQ